MFNKTDGVWREFSENLEGLNVGESVFQIPREDIDFTLGESIQIVVNDPFLY